MPNFSGIWNLKEQLQGIAAGRWTGISLVELYSWGRNDDGGLGQNDSVNRSSPTQIGSETNWSESISFAPGGIRAGAIKTDGTLWLWGNNYFGTLGQNDRTNRSSPVQVGGDSDWTKFSVSQHALALKNTGELYAWGWNNDGQLGLSDRVARSSPVQVGALTTWQDVSASDVHSGALKTDGTIWFWGDNETGAIGDNSRTWRSSPVQVGADTDWAFVSAGDLTSFAIKTNGALYAWGWNFRGQLGLGDASVYGTFNRSSPTQVGALTNWAIVSGGDQITSAVKTDGTLWTWGYNNVGQLGHNNQISRSSPVQVGALTNWDSSGFGKLSSRGLETMGAIKTDGTLWTWGRNSFGQIGDNTTIIRSSPVQVGSETNWNSVSAAIRSVMGTTLTST